MQTFKVRQNSFNEVKKAMLISLLPLTLFVMATMTAICIWVTNDETDTYTLLIVLPVVATSAGIGLYTGLKKQEAVFESFTVIITNNMIIQERLNTSSMSINFEDIRGITKYKNGIMLINGKDSNAIIAVPVQLENYAAFESFLKTIHPITTKDKTSFWGKFQNLIWLSMGSFLFCIVIVNDKTTVLISSVLFTILSILTFIKLITSKIVNRRSKKAICLAFVISMAIICIKLFKLSMYNGS